MKSLYYTTNNNWEKAKKQVYRNQSSGLSYFVSLTRCLGKFDGVCELMLRYIMTEKLIISPPMKGLTKLKEQWGKSPVVLLHHPRKVLKSVGDTVTIATSYYRQLFHNAFSHYNFVVNQFSNGHVPFPCHHCQMENRTNRKSNRGQYQNKVLYANVMVGQYLIRN